MTRVPEERLREMLAGCEGAQGGPWKLDEFACYVWAPSEKGGEFPIMDDLTKAVGVSVGMLRGWGYYTGKGHGALGLSPDEATDRMRRTGEHIAACDPATITSLITELLELRSEASRVPEWQDIETAPRDRTGVILAVPKKDLDGFSIGEAYFDPETGDDGDWWWANTDWGDYHAGPLSEVNFHQPTHWMPLPASPDTQTQENDRG